MSLGCKYDKDLYMLAANKLSRVGAAATYLDEQRPHIWFTVEIRLTQPQVELEPWLSLTKVWIWRLTATNQPSESKTLFINKLFMKYSI